MTSLEEQVRRNALEIASMRAEIASIERSLSIANQRVISPPVILGHRRFDGYDGPWAVIGRGGADLEVLPGSLYHNDNRYDFNGSYVTANGNSKIVLRGYYHDPGNAVISAEDPSDYESPNFDRFEIVLANTECPNDLFTTHIDQQQHGHIWLERDGYTGPFSVTWETGDVLRVNEGYVFAGKYAEWHCETTDIPITGALWDDTWLLTLVTEVDPLHANFNATYKPYLEWVLTGAAPDVDPVGIGAELDAARPGAGLYPDSYSNITRSVIARVEITNGGSVINMWQGQYGHIYVPVFGFWGIASGSGGSVDNHQQVEAPTYVTGWQHAHFSGRIVNSVPGIVNGTVSQNTPYFSNGDGYTHTASIVGNHSGETYGGQLSI